LTLNYLNFYYIFTPEKPKNKTEEIMKVSTLKQQQLASEIAELAVTNPKRFEEKAQKFINEVAAKQKRVIDATQKGLNKLEKRKEVNND
jgi:hypothetical protein